MFHIDEDTLNELEAQNQLKNQIEKKMFEQSLAKKAAIDTAKQLLDTRGLTGVKSKYDEDVHEDGHCSVWGSYWHSVLGWGYRCCYCFDKKAKCRGEEGKVETIKKEYELELKQKESDEVEERKKVDELNLKFKPQHLIAQQTTKEEPKVEVVKKEE